MSLASMILLLAAGAATALAAALPPALRWQRTQQRMRLCLAAELERSRRLQQDLGRRFEASTQDGRRLGAHLERLSAVHGTVLARYRSLLEHARDVELFTDARGVIVAASPSTRGALGLEPAQLTGRQLRSLIPAHHIIEHPFDALREDGDGLLCDGIEAPVVAGDGSIRELLVRTRRLDAGGSVNFAVQLHDAGGMKKAMATLERARTLERSAHQSRDLFIATMSHELRTPLHGLIATLDMMRADEQLPPQFEQRLAIARLSARALLRIANDILDLTRIESGHIQLEQKPFDLERIVEEVVDESQARADSLGLQLEWHLRDALPPSFIGDAARLKQVLGNLVANALQYTQAGGVKVEVAHDGRQCTIDVIDTGSGIPADKWQTIFDPFVQVPSTRNQRVGGTGLGLPISRRLIEAMGGTLNLARSDASGSVFRICAPLVASNETPADEQSVRIFSNPRARVLVVEDNPANRYVAEALLTSLECPVTLVESGEEALQELAAQEFDLVLMDCQMPGMDGYETTRRARSLLKKRIPIIAMTANAMMDDRRHCIEAGMDDFLAKPFGRQSLHAMLCKWLDPAARRAGSAAADEAAHRVASLPALDLGVFEELRESLQWRVPPLRNIRDTFATSAHSTVELLESSSPPGAHLLRRHLHTLLGSAGMVGARQVEYIAQRLQAGFEANDRVTVAACVAMLRAAVQRFESEFDQRLELAASERDWSGHLRHGTGVPG